MVQLLGQHPDRLFGNMFQIKQHQRIERTVELVIGIKTQHAAVEL